MTGSAHHPESSRGQRVDGVRFFCRRFLHAAGRFFGFNGPLPLHLPLPCYDGLPFAPLLALALLWAAGPLAAQPPRPGLVRQPPDRDEPEPDGQGRLRVRHRQRVPRGRLSPGHRGLESRHHPPGPDRRWLLVSRRQDRGFQSDPFQRARRALPEGHRLCALGPAGRHFSGHRLGDLRVELFPRERERLAGLLPGEVRQRTANGADLHAAHGHGAASRSRRGLPRRCCCGSTARSRSAATKPRATPMPTSARAGRTKFTFVAEFSQPVQKRQNLGGRRGQ